jgi:hypothetical protein
MTSTPYGQHLASLFAAIPHQWHDSNPIARYEGFYASVFYSHLAALGLDLVPEDASHHGRLDLRLRFNGRIWLFERLSLFRAQRARFAAEAAPTREWRLTLRVSRLNALAYLDVYRTAKG